MTIKIGILGYGNLGKGVECAVKHNPDMELAAVFTRRDKESLNILTPGVKVCSVQEAESMKDEIDVMILCGGSATDLPVQTPQFAKCFNVVDSFDTHARIPEHFEAVDAAAKDYLCGLGPGNVFPESSVWQCRSAGGQRLYLLGPGSQSGAF